MKTVRTMIALAMAVGLGSCDFFASTGPPPNTPGTYASFGVNHYDSADLDIPPNIPGAPTKIADYFTSSMNYYHWGNTANYRDDNVTASAMTATESNSDALFFAGHGDPGLMQLLYGEENARPQDQTSWGPGSTSHDYPSNLSGFPVQGRLKWIFAYSSQTASAPASLYPNNSQLTTNWLPAFGGSLHGIYGFEIRPGACRVGDPGFIRPIWTCDITTSPGQSFVQKFLVRTLTSNPLEPIHSAWENTAKDIGLGDKWGIWEDGATLGDVFSNDSAGVNFAPGGEIWYYYTVDPSGTFVGTPRSVGNDTFTLQPANLSPEPLNDSTMLNNAQPYFGNPDTYVNDGSTSTATKGATTIMHDLRTGALTFHGASQVNPMPFSQSDAYSSAVQAVSNSNGMPSDAVLTETDVVSKLDATSGGSAIIGYTFTWRHSGQPFGNDAIRVTVGDYHTTSRSCTGGYDYYYDQLGRSHMICMGWTTTVTDNKNISYMFRLWRQRGNFRSVQSLGQTSLTAATAAASLPGGAVVYDYAAGFWTGPFDDPTNNVAVPAWVFTLSDGTQTYVDAYSGVVLGSTKA